MFAGKWNPIASTSPVEVRDAAALGQQAGLGDLPGAAVPVLAEEIEDQLRRDEVEHDRGDHLVDVARDLEDRRDRRPHHRDQHRDEEDERDVQRWPQVPRADPEPERGGEQGSELVLAVDADVEQPHPESDGHGDARDVVRHGPVDDRDDRARCRRSTSTSPGTRRAGLSPAMSSAIDEMANATTAAATGAASPKTSLRFMRRSAHRSAGRSRRRVVADLTPGHVGAELALVDRGRGRGRRRSCRGASRAGGRTGR